MTVGMFQPPSTNDETRRYMVETFLAYVRILKVFSIFLSRIVSEFQVEAWSEHIDRLEAVCHKEAQRLDAAITASPNSG